MFVLNKQLDVDIYYIPLPITCRLVKAYSACTTQDFSVADGTVTFSDGTTTIGTITVPAAAVEGEVDGMTLDATSKGAVELGPAKPLKVELAGNTNGEVEVTTIFDEFHSAV